MCMNCGDFVDMCWQDECHNPSGGPYNKARKFYVDDKYCRHMQEKYGHEVATWDDQGKDYREDEESESERA